MRSIKLMFTSLICLVLLFGCATQVTEKPTETSRSSIALSSFSKVILVKSKIAAEYDGQGANLKAVKKVDEILGQRTKSLLSNVAIIEQNELATMDFSRVKSGETLIIEPYVKQVKFIGGAARFFAGAMAGSSVIIMDATFKDAADSSVIGKTGTYRRAGAYADPFGTGSNRMLSDAANDIANYIQVNR